VEVLTSLGHGGVTNFLIATARFLTEVLNILGFQNSCFRQYAGSVSSKVLISLEIARDGSISQEFLHHLLLGNFGIATSYNTCFDHFSDWFALLELSALMALCYMMVRSALLRNQMAVLSEQSIENWLSSIASFV